MHQLFPNRLHAGMPVVALGACLALVACGQSDDTATDTATSASVRSSSAAASPSSSASSSSAPTSSSPSTEPSSTTSSGRGIIVTITGSQVEPAPAQVDLAQGEELTLVITSDHDDDLHAHGFEVEKELKAGVATTVTFTGDAPGVYEVETHQPELRLMQIAVR